MKNNKKFEFNYSYVLLYIWFVLGALSFIVASIVYGPTLLTTIFSQGIKVWIIYVLEYWIKLTVLGFIIWFCISLISCLKAINSTLNKQNKILAENNKTEKSEINYSEKSKEKDEN